MQFIYFSKKIAIFAVLTACGTESLIGKIRLQMQRIIYIALLLLVLTMGCGRKGKFTNLYKQFFKRRLTVIIDADSFLPLWYRQNYSRKGPAFSYTGFDRSFHASVSLTLRYEFGKLQARVKNGSADMKNSDIKTSY